MTGKDRHPGKQAASKIDRRVRADAQRNIDSLLKSALTVFATSGVDAPVREIAKKAGVGIGTFYRHFPQRSDLIVAVLRQEIDACAEAAPVLAAAHVPAEALAKWLQRFTTFLKAKRGLAGALHSGNPAYDCLPAYFDQRLQPALQAMLRAAAATGTVRSDVDSRDLLRAVASLCTTPSDVLPGHVERMVALLLDGLRYQSAGRP